MSLCWSVSRRIVEQNEERDGLSSDEPEPRRSGVNGWVCG